MISTSDFKRGLRIELEGEPYVLLDYTMQGATARSSNSIVRAKLRNLRTGQLLDKSFRTGDRMKEPDFEMKAAQYLYDEGGETYYFMDQASYEQFPLTHREIEAELAYLRPNDEVRALFFNGACIGIELAATVVLEVAETEPGVKGDTVSNPTKEAKLETGASIQVPLFVEAGTKIVVDTRDGHYVRRA
ncbi:MAG: elongation factor P [Myxococcota bacterium]